MNLPLWHKRLPTHPRICYPARMKLRRFLVRCRRLLPERARAATFSRFLTRRFIDDSLFGVAGELSFTTVFALVPLSMVVFGVLSAFPVFDRWSDQLTDYVFSNFVPSSARAIETVLRDLAGNARQLTAIGVLALVVSLLVTLHSVESAFNRIWRVDSARANLARFLVYWTVLTLGALMAAASFAVSARFFALAVFQTEPGQWLHRALLWLTPMLIEWLTFAAIYRVVPHRAVQWRHALSGALLALVLMQLGKWSMGLYLGSIDTYERIYGQIAFVPIFLLWVYFGWISVLLGASLASALADFRYQPAALRLPPGFELYGLLRMLGRFVQYRRQGKGLDSDDFRQIEPMLSDSQVQHLIGQLHRMEVVDCTEHGQWVLTRDLDTLTLEELYDACQLRIPARTLVLPQAEDALGQAVVAAIDTLRQPLREHLRRDVASLFPRDLGSPS